MNVISRMRRDIAAHQRRGPVVALRGAYQSMGGVSGGPRIPVDTAATLRSATPWARRSRIQTIKRGPQYPAKTRGDVDAATKNYRLGESIGVSVQHPAGILAGPWTNSQKAPEGFHKPADREARRQFKAWRFNPRTGR